MELKPEISLQDVFSVAWLEQHDCILSIPFASVYVNIAVVRLMHKQLSAINKIAKVKKILAVYANVKERTIHTYANNQFEHSRILSEKLKAQYKKNIVQINTNELRVVVKDRAGQVKYEYRTTLEKISGLTIREVKQDEGLKFNKVLKRREELLEKLEPQVPIELQTIEDIAQKICYDYAAGVLTIVECCARYGINYITWAEWIQKSPYIQGIFSQAVQIANVLNQSKQLSMADNQIAKLLNKGYYEQEVTQMKLVTLPGRTTPEWQEVSKTKTKRDLTLNELSTLKSMLYTNYITGTNPEQEFSDKSEEEIIEFLETKGVVARPSGKNSVENNPPEYES